MINEHDIQAFKRFDNGPWGKSYVEEYGIQIMDDYTPDYFGKVKEFHDAFGHPFNLSLKHTDPEQFWFRWRLIQEEMKELGLEFTNADGELFEHSMILSNRDKILKETADLLYVIFGLCVTYNLPISEAFNRVHRSNMSKLGKDGKPIRREDGKILKGPDYKEPDLKDLV